MRSLIKMQGPNDGNRSLFESVLVPEVMAALRDWKNAGFGGVLIGGLALSFYVKPRVTQHVDILMLSDTNVPQTVPGFRKNRPHSFEHHQTHVEVEIVTPEYVSVPKHVVEQVIRTAVKNDGFQIASPSGLVALKLFRYSMQDQADIVSLIKHGVIDLSAFSLPQDKIAKFVALISVADAEK